MDRDVIVNLRKKRKDGDVFVGTSESPLIDPNSEPQTDKNSNPPQMRDQDNQIEFKVGGMVQRYLSRFRRDYDSASGLQIALEEQDPDEKMTEKKENSVNSKKKEEQKMQSLIKQTDRTLLKIQTIFPFTFFPQVLIIDENKITFIAQTFFLSKNTRNILLANVAEVKVNTSPFFASLTIIDMSFDRKQEIRIPYLWQKDALRARHIIQGIIIARKEGIDLSKFNQKELRQRIEELGSIKSEELG